ncbi:MAG: hypothetical protein JWR37_3247 [Mycobacterium sp.]|nr:hypothetical protein [Mycobacterium sp.]
MDDKRTEAGVLRRGWLRMLDGERCWGSIDIRPDRFGATRYRLVVYPPGLSEPERRRLRVWRGWPIWGALLWLVSTIWLANQIAPLPAVALSTGIVLGSGAIAQAAGDARVRVRTMGVMVTAGYYEPASTALKSKVERLATALVEADEHRDQGLISATDHELIWWLVYDQMPAGRVVRAEVHRPTANG